MRKGILIGIMAAAIAVGAAAAPPIVGTITQSEFAHVRDRVTAASPFVDSWTVRAFDQGYLSATATSELTVSHPDAEERTTIVLDHRIRHAPTVGTDLARIHTEPRIPDGDPRAFFRALYNDERAPLTSDTRIDLFGTRTITMHSPATDGMRAVDGTRIDWRGLDATVTIGRGERELAYRIDMPGLRLQPRDSELVDLQLDAVNASGAYEATAFDHVWTGGASGNIGRFQLQLANEQALTLTDLRFADSARLNNGLFGFSLETTAETLETPDYTLSALQLNVRGERIAPALLQALQQARGNDDGTIDGDEVMARLQTAPWGEIAAGEPLVRLESFEAQTQDGSVTISARAGLTDPANGQQRIAMDELMSLAQGEISAVVPERMAIDAVARSIAMNSDTDPATAERNATNTLRTLAAQGLLTIDNGTIEASAGYDRGAITINGRSLFGG